MYVKGILTNYACEVVNFEGGECNKNTCNINYYYYYYYYYYTTIKSV